MSLDKTDIVKWPSPHLPRLDDSLLGMGAQWEDDSDKCQCEWPGPGSLVSPSLVPCEGGSNQLVCGAAWCSVTWHTVDTPATACTCHQLLTNTPPLKVKMQWEICEVHQ